MGMVTALVPLSPFTPRQNNLLYIPNSFFTSSSSSKHTYLSTKNPFSSNPFKLLPSQRRNSDDASICCRKQQTQATNRLSNKHGFKPAAIPICVGWFRYLSISRRLISRIVGCYLLGLTFVGEVYADPDLSSGFSCENVSHYYASVDHKEGEDLLKVLNSIISSHQSLSYKEVWEALKVLDAADDANPESSSDVVEIYSLRVVSKLLAGKPEGWNREHLWPRSYGLTDGPSFTDLHNIRPADANVNSSRGNKYYGECPAKSAHCQKPANKEAAYDTEADKERWAPPSQVRGDIARAIMYMAICYGFNQADGSPNLHLSESPSMENREMGILSTLLKWNELDPPSRTEQMRNSRVCERYQHNRNPFVDHPEYANLIWKPAIPSKKTIYSPLKAWINKWKQVTPGSQKIYSSLNAWINEFHYMNKGKDKNEFIEIAVLSVADAGRLKVALYNGANGKVYRSLSLADKTNFQVTDIGSSILLYTTFVGLQNGPGDGIALVSEKPDGHVETIQFISYQGTVKAIDGPASGLMSVDIGIRETEGSSETDSLGLTGEATTMFSWRNFKNEASPSKLNVGQLFSVLGS